MPQRSTEGALTEGARIEEAIFVAEKPTKATVDKYDSTLEGPLPVAFEAALEKYAVVPKGNVKIIAIVTYYRSGSTFFGELLSSAPRTFFHFEPLMLFTVSGSIRPGRQRHAFQLLDALVRCRFEPLYTAWLESGGYYKFNHFLADICEGGQSCSSPGHLTALCSRAQTQVYKFTRLRISQVHSWIQINPEISHSVRIVHLVRDPRGIYFSRRGLRWCTDHKHCDSAAALCEQIRSDLDAFGELARSLREDRTYRIRFEDLAADTLNETQRLFRKLGLDFTRSVSEYIGNHTTATAAQMKDAHSTWRNTKEVADRWRHRLSIQTIRDIESTCSDVIESLGYRRF
ncbi:carbohydrate sulfotransferase 4-like [Rhipicephalus sanguineus]|uniref:carbohydrate sulfotransferase 4-like n=1 Tax=Rhipicephalus sanguineus TaxID=34632 RepID=UPI0020C3FE4A|nr:carbohydrate sulfotransferase 4-like [Rhipicephalus sanguineus]